MPSPPPSWKPIGVARVLYPYSAQGSTELNINVGDNVNVIEKYPNGWWVGEKQGKVGVFPGAYVTLEEIQTSPTPSINATTSPVSDNIVIRARALYDFNKTSASELSFKFNDELVITEKIDGGWWRAELNGKTGLVPRNYLQELTSPSSASQTADTTVAPSSTATNNSDPSFGVASMKIRTSVQDVTPSTDSRLSSANINLNSQDTNLRSSATIQPSTYLFKVRALYDFPGKEPNHLPLKKGDIVPVKLVPADGNPWWLGENEGRKGYFPMNYVQKIDESEEKVVVGPELIEESGIQLKAEFDFEGRTTSELSFKKGQLITLVKKLQPIGGWWKGETIDASGSRQIGNFPSNYVTVLDEKGNRAPEENQTQINQVIPPSEPSATNETAKEKSFVWAIDSYEASSPSELSFARGDKIEILEAPKEDGWAHGEKDGQRGFFPIAFVTTDFSSLTQEDHVPPPPDEDDHIARQQKEEQRRLQEEELQIKQQELRKQEEEAEQLKKQREEEEVRKQREEEEIRKQREEEEELRKQREEQLKKQQEEEELRKQREEQLRKQQEEEELRRQEESRKQNEEEMKRQEEIRRQNEEEQRQQREDELRRQEENRREEQREEELKKQREEELRRQKEEEQRQQREEALRREEEARRQEEQRQQREEELKRQREEEQRKQREEEQRRKKEEELRGQQGEEERRKQQNDEEVQRQKDIESEMQQPKLTSSWSDLPKVAISKPSRPLPLPKPKRNASASNEQLPPDVIIRSLERRLQLEYEARRQLEAKVAQLETKFETLSKAFADFQSSSSSTIPRAALRPTGRDLTK